MARARVLLAYDRPGWAFHHITQQVARLLRDEFDCDPVPYPDLTRDGRSLGYEPDIAAAFWWPSACVLWANTRARRRMLCMYDHYSIHRWPSAEHQFLLACRRADVIACGNEFLVAELPAEVRAKAVLIPDGVDTDLFRPVPLPERFTVGWTGREDEEGHKGLALIEEACRLARAELVTRNYADGVWPHDQMPEYYRQVSVYCCASEAEGTPNPPLEAGSCGRPSITTRVGIMPGFVQWESGRIVARRVDSFAAAICELRDMPRAELEAMGRAARQQAEAHSWEQQIEHWRDALHTALAVERNEPTPTPPRPVVMHFGAPVVSGLRPVTEPPLDRPDWTAEVTCFLVTTGEPSTAECRKRLEAQDVRVRVEEIRDVHPMDRAFQAMLDRCTTPLYVQVDADMLLEPWAVRRLVEAIHREPETVAQYSAWLWGDAEERPIQGVKVYRHAITKRYPYQASLSCEMPHVARMQADGFTTTVAPCPDTRETCFGQHMTLQSREMAFERWRRLAIKYRRFPYMAWLADRFPLLRKRFLELHAAGSSLAEVYEAAWLGALAGLTGPMPAEVEADARGPRDEWRRTLPIIGDWAAGPQECSLYVTQRCNARCTFCKRSTDPSLDGAGMMTPETLAHVLDRLPTVRAACIAGFGEPLLNPHLAALVDLLHERHVNTNLITNGLLLSERAESVAGMGLGRVTVSLNATSREEHEAIHRVPGWDRVLDGVRALVCTGVKTCLSFVTHRGNAVRIPEMIALGRDLGACSIDLPNILPHAGVDDPWFVENVIRADSVETLALIAEAKALPGADIVGHWPVPIDPEGECPRRCDSPFMSIGVDHIGNVTGCRRIAHPVPEHGSVDEPGIWHGQHYQALRQAQTGDRPLPDACRWCFASWSR